MKSFLFTRRRKDAKDKNLCALASLREAEA